MRFLLLFACWALLSPLQSQSLLEVTSATQPPYSATTLIDHYFTGAGIEVLDVQFAGASQAAGFFTGGEYVVGLKRGIVLSTGVAASNSIGLGVAETGDFFASTNTGSPVSLPELSQIATANLFDVAYYRITFRPSSDSIRFRYVFASEEYPEYSCTSFNDVFGFFLDGPNPGGGNYLDFNMALVPGTYLPVSINTVHPYNPAYTCSALNDEYYIDNDMSGNQPVYDGFTVPFVAEAAVVPCETYVMTIAIGDVSDGIFDSGVFLEGNSFGGSIDISSSFAAEANVIPENAIGDTVDLVFSNIPAALLPLNLQIGGTAQNGVDYQLIDSVYTISTSDTLLHLLFQPIPDTLNEGVESVLLSIDGPGCVAKQFSLFISDVDSSMLQGPEIYALVNGTAHLEVIPTAIGAQSFTFSNEEDISIGTNNMATSEVQVALPLATLNDIHMIQSVCMDVEHGWVGDLDVFLLSPEGRFLELSSDNGNNGDNYTGTCFSPDASGAINFPGPFAPADAAPFTGVFQPEGVWEDLLKVGINGAWKLALQDGNSGFDGTLKNWSITFAGERFGAFHYLWNTGDTTAAIDVTEPGIYMVLISNDVSHFLHKFVVTECPYTQLYPQVCAGEQFTLGASTFDANQPSGVVVFDLPGVDCDSSVFVQLEILPQYSDTISAVIAAGDTLFLAGQAFTEAGNYTLSLNTAQGCDSTLYIQVQTTSGVTIPGERSLTISPNPASDQVLISWDKTLEVNNIRIVNAAGTMLLERTAISSQQERVDFQNYPAGTYLIQLEAPQGTINRRIVKGF